MGIKVFFKETADKHESLLQIDTMILVGIIKHSQSTQSKKFAISLQYLKKEVRNGVHFLHADKQSFTIIIVDNGIQDG